MIKNCHIDALASHNVFAVSTEKTDREICIKVRKQKALTVESLVLIVDFDQPIVAWRGQDYQWNDNMSKELFSNDYAPKILVLKDGTHVLSSKNLGSWMYSPKKPNQLRWVLKHPRLTPVISYDKASNRRIRCTFAAQDYNLTLLFTKEPVPEFSRSKVPFSPIICFTDHCDFDTNDSLKKQLAFFKKHNLRVSKGFFLNHFSKRQNNSSYKFDAAIIDQFHKEGHELVYHSLTQSIRDKKSAIDEFSNFKAPTRFKTETWIDHGYQPYNFTKRQDTGINDQEWADTLRINDVKNLWTYLDSGTASQGIINQLNPEHFTLSRIRSQKELGFRFLFRTAMFFAGGEKMLMTYRKFAKSTKNLLYRKKLNAIIPGVTSGFKALWFLFLSLSSSKKRNTPFTNAQYAPFIFRHEVGSHTFMLFQTVEVTDFENSFSPENLDLLCKENGAIIVHCYFSSPLKHQSGKLFNGDEISSQNDKNFSYLHTLITEGKIWNPTVSQLIKQHRHNLEIEYFFDEISNKIVTKNQAETAIRYIKYG